MPRLWADELRVKQMVNNLLTNAVKFTEPGGRVVISVRPSYAPNGVQDGVDIVVRDTGIGMDPAEIPMALSPFGQVDQGLARRHEGTGLGLPLVRRMIELHQGVLSISSARGKAPRQRCISRPTAWSRTSSRARASDTHKISTEPVADSSQTGLDTAPGIRGWYGYKTVAPQHRAEGFEGPAREARQGDRRQAGSRLRRWKKTKNQRSPPPSPPSRVGEARAAPRP